MINIIIDNDNLRKEPVMLYERILEDRLRINVLSEASRRGLKVHKSSIVGLIPVLVRLLINAEQRKHFRSNGHFDGNHIMSSEISLLKRNKLAQNFICHNLDAYGRPIGEQLPFFCRAEGSTYHTNTSRNGYNGYTHWYEYDDTIRKSVDQSYWYFEAALGVNEKFGESSDDYAEKVRSIAQKPENLDETQYLVVGKERFSHVVKKFVQGVYEGGSTIINRAEFADDDYVYIRNTIKNNGDGRVYTTLSSLRKDVREFLLKGYQEIDLNTSVQTILLNLYYDRCIDMDVVKEEFPQHYALLKDKDRFRERIAHHFKCDMDQAKKIITSITYSPNARIIYKNCTLREFSAKRTKQCKDLISPFVEESKKLQQYVLDRYYLGKIKEMVDLSIAESNKNLKGKGKGKSLGPRRISRIYEIFEMVARNSMMGYLREKNPDREIRVYQIHDGVIFDGNADHEEMMDYVRRETRLSISAKHRTL